MKALIVLVAVAALGATALTIAVGARLKEPTVVANPYEEGLKHDVRRKAAPAPAAPGHDELALEIEPRPPRAMEELTFTVRATRDGRPLDGASVAVTLSMPGMRMVENRVALAPAGGGVYRGKGAVVRCPSGGRGWTAEVTATPLAGTTVARQFTFEVAGP